jgi:hypothetical protein
VVDEVAVAREVDVVVPEPLSSVQPVTSAAATAISAPIRTVFFMVPRFCVPYAL